MTGPRWPIEPLLATGVTPAQLRARLGGAGYQRATVDGLSDQQADRIAIALGHHPANVWPDWADAALTALDRLYLAGGWRQAWLWQEAS
jgi:hypothetical protein